MRCQFPGFFPLKKGEYADFLKSAVISYDANILLNLYRIKPDTAALFYKLLDKTKNQTFISNQATYEFLKNRTTVIYEHDFSESNRRINAFIQKTRDNLKTISGFRFREIEKIASEIDHFFQECFDKLSKLSNDERDLLEEDSFLEQIESLVSGRIGQRPSEEILKQIYKDGEERYKKKIPPGFNDDKKNGEEKFGDLLIWTELLKYCKSANKPLVFVTDDEKDDWWNIVKGKKCGPRAELLQEFHSETGQRVVFFTFDKFLAKADVFGIEVESNAIEDAKDTREKVSQTIPVRSNTSEEMMKIINSWSPEFLNSQFPSLQRLSTIPFENLKLPNDVPSAGTVIVISRGQNAVEQTPPPLGSKQKD